MIDLGDEHSMQYFSWAPDDIGENKKLFGEPLPNIEKAGCTVQHLSSSTGAACVSAIHFDIPEAHRYFPGGPLWQVQSWDPLTLSPSLLCLACGDHGFIRANKWVKA